MKSSATYEEFLHILKAKGYEIKGESFEDGSPKYISFRPADKERFVRGSAKSLGKEYTKERIKERIDSGLERNFKVLPRERISKGLIDMEQEKIKGSPGLKRWAAVENLKNISESYNDAGSIMELEQKLSDISAECKSAKNDLLQTEKRLKSLMEILKYAKQYQATLPYYNAYRKAKNRDSCFRKHESEIILRYKNNNEILDSASPISHICIISKAVPIRKQRTIFNGEVLIVTLRRKPNRFEHDMLD